MRFGEISLPVVFIPLRSFGSAENIDIAIAIHVGGAYLNQTAKTVVRISVGQAIVRANSLVKKIASRIYRVVFGPENISIGMAKQVFTPATV